MFDGIYSVALALNNGQQQHEIIANNLANLNSAGFRKTLLSFNQAPSPNSGAGAGASASAGRGNQLGKPEAKSVIDFTPGPLRQTERPLDVAIAGDGFFSVQGPEATRYTRNGSFQLAADGSLVTADGHPLLSGGRPLQLPPQTDINQIKVAADGSLSVGGTPLGRIELIDFADKSRLRSVGSASFRAPPDASTTTPSGKLVQGSLEMANTNAVTEMVQLIVTSRHFEASQRVLRTIAETIEKSTNSDRG